VFLALAPLAVGIALAVFVALMLIWRYVSLGSIAAAATMPLVVMLSGDAVLKFVTVIIAVVVIAKHHENIRRLLAGTESRFKA